MKIELDHATPELFSALSRAQGEIENAAKNRTGQYNEYADLAEILNTVRPVFSKEGLSVVQSPSFDGTLASVTTIIAHSGGGYICGTASCSLSKSDAQGVGSATTYLRRYGLAAMSGIAQEDDDGQEALGEDSDINAENAAKFSKEISTADKAKLKEIADSLSKANLPVKLLQPLRDAWAARNKELQKPKDA